MYKNLYNKIYKMLLIRREINKVRREQQEESRGMNYHVSAKDFKQKEIYDLGEEFGVLVPGERRSDLLTIT